MSSFRISGRHMTRTGEVTSRQVVTAVLATVALSVISIPVTAAPALRLAVDASEAPRHILHARLRVPAAPGPLTLVYPKWIPGEHGPTGPIAGLVGLRVTAAGKEIPWRRDPEDLYAFHVEVPARVSELELTFDAIPGPRAPGTARTCRRRRRWPS
jgi:hypothetical protein